jgi:integrase
MLAEVPPRDPIEERNRLRDEARKADAERSALRTSEAATLARCARDYHARAIEPRRSAKHAREWIASLERLMPAQPWRAPIATIEAPRLLDAMAGLYLRVPVTAARMRQRLEAVFDDAIFRGLCRSNPAAAIRRKVREIKRPRIVQSHRALRWTDVPDFVQALREQPGVAARALEFGLLCAARTGEIIGARWSEVDFGARTWTVPAERMKGGEAHMVPLSDRALTILRDAQGIGGEWVFPSPHGLSQPLSNMAMLTLLRRMGYTARTTVHGLCRASFSTWANETGAARPDVVEAALAHREGDRIRAAYNRAQFADERRKLLDAWADFCDGHTARADVIPLHAMVA